jgi:hypothetical protein
MYINSTVIDNGALAEVVIVDDMHVQLMTAPTSREDH